MVFLYTKMLVFNYCFLSFQCANYVNFMLGIEVRIEWEVRIKWTLGAQEVEKLHIIVRHPASSNIM